MNPAKKTRWSHETLARKFRVLMCIIVLINVVGVFWYLSKGAEWREENGKGIGKARPEVYQSAILSMIGVYAPLIVLVSYWFKFENWKDQNGEKIYVWQGIAATILVIFFTYYSLSNLNEIILSADYLEPPGKESPDNPYIKDCSKLLSSRLSEYFMYQSLIWAAIPTLGLLIPAKDKSPKTSK